MREAAGPGASRAVAPATTAQLVASLSLAGDMGIGLPLEHCLRACYIGLHLAARLQLDSGAREDVFWTLLLKDAGCTSFTTQAATFIQGNEIDARRQLLFYKDGTDPHDIMEWALAYLGRGRLAGFMENGRDFFREGFRSAIEVAQRIATRLEMRPSVGEALAAQFERWDGKGMPNGIRAEAIPIVARVTSASTYFEIFSRMGGPDAARRLGLARKGTAFDEAVVDAFFEVSATPGFWPPLESESILEMVLSLKPGPPPKPARDPELDVMALAFADFVDMKSHFLAGHSRRVADLADGIGRRLKLSSADLTRVHRAALMHDVGFVAVPSFTVNRPPEERSRQEHDAIDLHPQYAETMLAIVPALAAERAMVVAHHERPDGGGLRRLPWVDVPMGARIIAAADRFDELTHDQPGAPAIDPDTALAQLRASAGESLDPEVLRALVDEVSATDRASRQLGSWPAGLTEREVEVLRLLGRGLSRAQVAQTLVISDATVRHHLEHIYDKIGVTTQVAAVLFALENGLLS